MSRLKAILAGFLSAVCLFTASGCGSEAVPIEPQAQDMLRQEVALLFNDAVQKLNEVQNYKMAGSVNSSSVMGEVLTSVVTSIDCKYEKDADGNARMLMNSEQRYDGMVFPHSTYYADGKYYISALESNYVVAGNDFGDYDATMYAKRVEETAITNYTLQTGNDGVGYQIRFEIPFGIYSSEALEGWIGDLIDESILQQPVTVRANINDAGMITSMYISVENSATFGDEAIEQSVTVSLSFTDYNTTTVIAPEGLDAYEDRTQAENDGENHGDFVDPGEVNDGSLD